MAEVKARLDDVAPTCRSYLLDQVEYWKETSSPAIRWRGGCFRLLRRLALCCH